MHEMHVSLSLALCDIVKSTEGDIMAVGGGEKLFLQNEEEEKGLSIKGRIL